MNISEMLLSEFDREMTTTRSLLERVPETRSSWKPHPKSFSLWQLAIHISNLPRWAIFTMTASEFDMASPEAKNFAPPPFESTAKLLESFDRNVAGARAAIAGASDDDYGKEWTFRNGEQVVFAMPRLAALRQMSMNHGIHHRGQLSVYLRELDVPLPPIYGPTADSAGGR
jgi:uncharacterized damage-inducible protein DinB